MTDNVKWGILGTAKIAHTWLVPAIQAANNSEVLGIASRNTNNAKGMAQQFGIAKTYDSYEAMLADPDVDAIYNPLPNHLHTPWSIAALSAGKHVLCEKPLGLDSSDAKCLVDAAAEYPELKVMEAFMYRFHPQWQKVKEIMQSGKLGKVSNIYAVFSYFNDDPNNVRNMSGIGGGGLLDIGCYCVSVARFLFNEEPSKVFADIDFDPSFNTDRLTLGTMRFPSGRAQFRCSTQCQASQRVVVTGDQGELIIPTPYYQEPGKPVELHLSCAGEDVVTFEVESCNHYVAQVEAFANSVKNNLPVPTPLSDALANMHCLDALQRSHESGGWVDVKN